MYKKKIFFLLLCICHLTNAQYTELINSNYPGFSQSPYSVGKDVYQFESNFFYRKAPAMVKFDNPESLGVNIHFRTSFIQEKFELNLQTALQNDIITFNNLFKTSKSQFGLGQFTLGAKYLVYAPKYTDKTKEVRSWKKRHGFDSKRWIPHVGVYAGLNVGSILNDYHKNGGVTPKVGILLQNEFDLRYHFITNIYYDYIGSDFAEWSYIFSATYVFNEYWSGFIEHQAKFNSYESTGNLGGGVAYLFNEDLQINSSFRASKQDSGLGNYMSLGLSYRIDKHVDDFVELDDFGNPLDENGGKEKLSFFERLLKKVKGIFKKTEGVEIEITGKDGKTVKKEVDIPVETNNKKSERSVLDDIIKDDKKQKTKKLKEDYKKTKKAKKNKYKEQRKIEKEKEKRMKASLKEKEEAIEDLKERKRKILKQKEKNNEDLDIKSQEEKEIQEKLTILYEDLKLFKKDMSKTKELRLEEERLRREDEEIERKKLEKEKEKIRNKK